MHTDCHTLLFSLNLAPHLLTTPHASQPTYLRVSTGLERQQQLMATDNIREGLDSLGGLGPRALTLTQRFLSLGELLPIAPKLYSYCVAHPLRWTKKKIKKK